MTDNDIEAILKLHVEAHFREMGDEVEVESDDDLVEIGFDSIGYVRLLDFIQSRFGIRVPDADVTVERFGSIAGISNYLENSSADVAG